MTTEPGQNAAIGVEELLATLVVFLLAGAFIVFQVWPKISQHTQSVDAPHEPATAAVMRGASADSTLSIRGTTTPDTDVRVTTGDQASSSTRSNAQGKWRVTTRIADDKPANDIRVETLGPAGDERAHTIHREPASYITRPQNSATAPTQPIAASAAAPQPGAAAPTAAAETPVSTATVKVPAAARLDTTAERLTVREAHIAAVERDGTKNMLTIRGFTPDSDKPVRITVDNARVPSIQADAQGHWEYSFPANPGAYLVGIVKAPSDAQTTGDGTRIVYRITLTAVAAEPGLTTIDVMPVGEEAFPDAASDPHEARARR